MEHRVSKDSLSRREREYVEAVENDENCELRLADGLHLFTDFEGTEFGEAVFSPSVTVTGESCSLNDDSLKSRVSELLADLQWFEYDSLEVDRENENLVHVYFALPKLVFSEYTRTAHEKEVHN